MQILPSCSEGARRLSLLLAVLTVAAILAVSFVIDRQASAADTGNVTSQAKIAYIDAQSSCRHNLHQRGLPYDELACAKEAGAAQDATLQQWHPSNLARGGQWMLYVLLAAVAAYLVCLLTRSISWVRQGYTMSSAVRF